MPRGMAARLSPPGLCKKWVTLVRSHAAPLLSSTVSFRGPTPSLPKQLGTHPGTTEQRTAGTCFPHGKEALDVTRAAASLGTIAPSPVGRQDTSVTSDNAAGP